MIFSAASTAAGSSRNPSSRGVWPRSSHFSLESWSRTWANSTYRSRQEYCPFGRFLGGHANDDMPALQAHHQRRPHDEIALAAGALDRAVDGDAERALGRGEAELSLEVVLCVERSEHRQ